MIYYNKVAGVKTGRGEIGAGRIRVMEARLINTTKKR